MNPSTPTILIGVFARILTATLGGWLIARGANEQNVNDFIAAAVAIAVPIIWGYVSRVKLWQTEPPREG